MFCGASIRVYQQFTRAVPRRTVLFFAGASIPFCALLGALPFGNSSFTDDIKVVIFTSREDVSCDIGGCPRWSDKLGLPLDVRKGQLLSRPMERPTLPQMRNCFLVEVFDRSKGAGIIMKFKFKREWRCILIGQGVKCLDWSKPYDALNRCSCPFTNP